MQILLSTAYFPPITYFKYLIEGTCIIEANENFQKQSYRNRCAILTANGKEQLVIPVKHQEKSTNSIREQRVSYAENWQIKHWRSITSAYNHSPFFEFYKDEISSIFFNKYDLLFDLNHNLLALLTKFLQIKMPSISEEWERFPHSIVDMRNEIHPKIKTEIKLNTYHQVFISKFGFSPNLSILDLLFNLGPDAHIYLLMNR